MRCPFCKDEKGSKVLDSREASSGFVIRRRRECLACERRFTTYERVEETPLRVVKKDESREDFDRQKIVTSLERSCAKRPVDSEKLAEVAVLIEREIRDVHEREVPSRFIGELIMRELKKLDKVAYVRYASVYRNFQDPEDFFQELRPLLDQPPS
jgi:transcriptional repressor NrdR